MKKTAIILGSKPASVAALLILKKRGWEIKEVVASRSQADWIPEPSLYKLAENLNIPVVEKQTELKKKSVNLVISYMYRSLVKEPTLLRGEYAINFHAGPLPEFGGWAFYNAAILENSREYGCTCHIMDNGFDTGPLVKVRRFHINPNTETAYSLERKAQLEMLFLFEEVLSIYESSGKLPMEAQPLERMRYMKANEFSVLKEVPITATQEEIDRTARAFWYPPYEMAYMTTPLGVKVELVPEIVKQDIAHRYHASDLDTYLKVFNLKHKVITGEING